MLDWKLGCCEVGVKKNFEFVSLIIVKKVLTLYDISPVKVVHP